MSAEFITYSELVGKVFANLQALEFTLRNYLYAKADAPHVPLQQAVNHLQVGSPVPENAFTDWSSLGHLIDRYNRRVGGTHPDLVVDRSLVDLRDALAHGRVWLPELSAPPLLLKFEKPTKGATTVTFKQVMSSEWLEPQLQLTAREIQKVQEARRVP